MVDFFFIYLFSDLHHTLKNQLNKLSEKKYYFYFLLEMIVLNISIIPEIKENFFFCFINILYKNIT